nr:hypothetical protein [Tanacetum cinerariifolium]
MLDWETSVLFPGRAYLTGIRAHIDLIDDYNWVPFLAKYWRFISWRARWPADDIIVGAYLGDGLVSYEDYCLLANIRSSTSTKEKREIVYYMFQAYGKMKSKHEEFDLGDFALCLRVILHKRMQKGLKSERGEFDLGDFVNEIYRRLKNRSYKGDQMNFVYIDEVQDLSMRQLSLFKYICQNVEGFMFAGDIAQTIAKRIDFRFQDIRSLFIEFLSARTSECKKKSIDKIEPETSLIFGEPPVLLESGHDENAIVAIFGGSKSGDDIVGFGAEQVILVRDDHTKTEVCEFVGKKVLVLTIVECKGLEFQDVLFYNFFRTSPLEDQWRVIYGYMKIYDWLKDKLSQSSLAFNEARHIVLCSELKQLYVAVRKLDDLVAQAMHVASTAQEWRERGKKGSSRNLESIGKLELAASCYYDLREYERAGSGNFIQAANLARLWGDLLKEAKCLEKRLAVEKFRDGGFEDVYVAPKEEIESVLFLRIGSLDVHTSSNNAGTIPEVSSSNTYMNMNTVKMQMDWYVLEEISNAKNGKKRVAPNKLPTATMVKVIIIYITVFVITRSREVKYPLLWMTLELAVNRLQSYKPKIDKFLNSVVTCLVLKAEQTCDSVVVENQSDYDNTQDGTNKKGKGNKGQKSKKSRGTQLVYMFPDIVLSIDDFYNHVDISIQTHGYDTWQGDESNLLVIMAMIDRLSNTSYMGFQYSVDNVVDHLTTTGITTIPGERRSVEELEGVSWNLKPSEQITVCVPSRVEVNERLNRSLSLQFERYRRTPQPARYSVDQHDQEILGNDHLNKDEQHFIGICLQAPQTEHIPCDICFFEDCLNEARILEEEPLNKTK